MNSVQPVESSPDVSHDIHPISEIVIHSAGPAPCRCGRYFSKISKVSCSVEVAKART